MKRRLLTNLLAGFTLHVYSQPGKKPYSGNAKMRDSMIAATMKSRFSSMNQPCFPRAEYSFQHNILVKTTFWKTGKDTGHTSTRYYFQDSGNYFGTSVLESDLGSPESRKMTTVRVISDSVLIMLNTDKNTKRGFCSSFKKSNLPPHLRNQDTNDSLKTDWNKIKKSGKTKLICGLLCEEFILENASETQTFWITKESSLFTGTLQKTLTGIVADSELPSGAKGMTMEMTLLKKEKQKYYHWVVTELNKNTPGIISTAGYTFN